ncbi:hypothetical protein HR12_37905 [Microbacterium sp. SUBG005]|nr:hypothetical protein HR12_37905 [Microbacterium sp. SUBG005]
MVQLQRRFISANAHFQLCHDTARIGTAYHFVQRYAGFRFTVNQRPVQRRTATVGRQQRAVQVKMRLFVATLRMSSQSRLR